MGISLSDRPVPSHSGVAAVHLEARNREIAAAAKLERHEDRRVDSDGKSVRPPPAGAVETAVEDDFRAISAQGQPVAIEIFGVHHKAPVAESVGPLPVAGDGIGAGRKNVASAAGTAGMIGQAMEGFVIVGSAVADEPEPLDDVDGALSQRRP